MDPPRLPGSRYDTFQLSMTPQWRKDRLSSSVHMQNTVHIVDISSTGDVHRSLLKVNMGGSTSLSSKDYSREYQARLEEESQALRIEGEDLKTRLVLFSNDFSGFVRDLCGVEFQLERSFFDACTPNLSPHLFLEESP